jgi:hypothetical protein
VEETATRSKAPVAASQVPLPQPRPAEAPARTSAEAAKAKDEAGKADDKGDDKGGAKNSGKDEAAAPPPPSACRIALTEEVAIAPSVPSIHGPGECGGDDLVRLEAVVLPNKKRVALTPTGIMRCTMATAVVNWIRNDVAPEVAKLGSEITALDNFDSYECRGRNGVPGAKLSEHGHANAIDVHGFKLADGRLIALTDRSEPREFREAVLHSACTRFPTVLGPDSDFHHEDHIHVDLIERRSNYRICQWDVLDPLPKVAPSIPEVRPDDAPPREVAEAVKPNDKAKDQSAAKVNDAKGNDSKGGDARSSDAKDIKGKDTKGKDADKPSKTGDDKAGNEAAGKDRIGRDTKQDTKPATDKVVKETGSETSVTPKPSSPAGGPAAKSPAETAGKDKPETRPAAEASKAAAEASKTAADHAMPDKASPNKSSADKESTDKTPTEKPSPEKASSEKASSGKTSSDKTSTEKPSRKKIAADRPASKKRRHRAREWNPFAGFF